jgi:hypothetical protein
MYTHMYSEIHIYIYIYIIRTATDLTSIKYRQLFRQSEGIFHWGFLVDIHHTETVVDVNLSPRFVRYI